MAERPDPEHPLLYERLYRHVFDEVAAGRLQPGERVPSEKALAEQFGVSRITSQRALRNLDRAGLVLRVRGKGSFVADPLPDLTDPEADFSSMLETGIEVARFLLDTRA